MRTLTKGLPVGTKLLLGLAALYLGTSACAAGTTTRRVKMDTMHSQIGELSGLEEDPLEKQPVEYTTTGKPKYDEFFKEVAELRAGLVVSKSLSETLTNNVKNYARTYAASNAADENVKALVGKSPSDQLDTDQSIALLALKKKQGELSNEETQFATKAVANTAQTGIYLEKSGERSKTLLEQGAQLSQSVSTDFTGADAPKAPGVAKSLNGAMDNVKQCSVDAPEVAKNLARLGEGLKSLL